MSVKNKRIISKAFSVLLSLTMALGIILPLVHIDATAASSSDTLIASSDNTNLALFNSGVTSQSSNWTSPNPAPNTYNNSGYDIYASLGGTKRVRLGLSFEISETVAERSTLSVSAYDVDEDTKGCSHGYEYDYIYLVDETSGNSTQLDGHMSGQNNTWDNTVFTIDPSLFTTGHKYHFEISMSCTGSTSCAYYSVKVRTVSLQVGITGASAPAPEGIEEANLQASISSSGLVSVSLTAKAYEQGSYTVEYKAVYSADNSQKGGVQQNVTIGTSSSAYTSSFSLNSGAPRGTYVITAFIKDGSGNVKTTREITVSYGYLAVSYNSNGGSQNLPVDLNAYDPEDPVTVLFDYIPSRAGYIFLGWAFESNATEPDFTENGNTSFNIASDVILYAVWGEEPSEPPVVEPPVSAPADVWDGSAASGFGGGSGTESDPYLIYTAEELAYLASRVNSGNSYSGQYFKLMNDIDLAGKEWSPIGKSEYTTNFTSAPYVFSGNFDGNNHVISNLCVTQNKTSVNGLFGCARYASFKNLGIEGATVSNRVTSYRIAGGALLAYGENVNVDRCYAIGATVSAVGSDSPSSAGGLIGIIKTATVSNCFTHADVFSNLSAGGIVGSQYSSVSHIINCYSVGNISHDTTANGRTEKNFGGILGYCGDTHNSGSIKGCFYVGHLNTTYDRGGICGRPHTSVPITNSYHCLTSGSINMYNGTSTSHANLTSEIWIETNLPWDFDEIWTFDGVSEYPTLRGFGASSPVTPPTPSCDHSEYDVIVDVEPTCTESGRAHAVCKECGDTLETAIVIPALDHSYYVAAELAETCTANGYVVYACNNCSYTRTQIIYATGHDFGTDNVCDECGYEVESHTHEYTETVIAPTCTTVGYTVYECSCGHTYRTDYIDQTGHRWGSGEITTERSCTTEGVKTYTCSECGETRVEIIPAGHDWSESVTVEKTCETDGEITRTCNDCGETETEVIPAGHTWLDGTVITEPTCTEPGTKEVACSVCGASETQEIDVLGHTFVNGRCTRCGAGIEDVVTPNEGHPEYGMYFEIDDILSNYGPDPINEYGVLLDYNEGANIQKVGVYLVQDGTMWRRCIACVGEGITYATYVPYLSYDEDIKYTGLNSPYINIFRLKENSDGIWCYSNYTTIGVNLQDAYGNLLLSLYDIGQAGAKTRVFDNLEEMIDWLREPSTDHTHTESDWIIDLEATCVAEGEMHKECTNCGEILATEIIPATGEHTEGDWIVDKEPTCQEEGSQHKECTVCGSTVAFETLPPTYNHVEGEWIIDSEPNCIYGGSRHKECINCRMVIFDEYLSPTGIHTESEWIITKAPTTTSQGERYKECTVCYTVIETEIIPALPKIEVNSVVARAGYTVNVTVDIQNNPGILGAILTIDYDPELKLVGISTGAGLSSLSFTEPGVYESVCNFVWDGDVAPDTTNGTILTLTFEVPADACDGRAYNVGFCYQSENMVDGNCRPVDVHIENGSITVESLRGDVNDDGVVNVADVITLRRYLAGGYDLTVNLEQADVNEDGYITILDVIRLREYILSN